MKGRTTNYEQLRERLRLIILGQHIFERYVDSCFAETPLSLI